MEPKFKLGDLVVLKSGGPAMTVTIYDENTTVYSCKWYCADTSRYCSDYFKEETLTMTTGVDPQRFR